MFFAVVDSDNVLLLFALLLNLSNWSISICLDD